MVELMVGVMVCCVILGWLLGRRAVWLGLALLALGLGPIAASYLYETYFYVSGDTSNFGTLSFILLILCAPPGVTLVVFGFLRGE